MNLNSHHAEEDDMSNRDVPQHISAAIPRKNRSLGKRDTTNPTKQSIPAKKRLFKSEEKLPRRRSSLAPSRWERGDNQNPTFRISQTPFVIGIKFMHLPPEVVNSLKINASSRLRTSGRNLKRKLYAEANDSDSDFLKDSDDDEEKWIERPKKRLQKASSIKHLSGKNVKTKFQKENQETKQQPLIINGEDTATPPNGILASLWYSREIYSHIWVIDKIIGWKKRKKVSISYRDESVAKLNDVSSRAISDKLINYFIPQSSKRMELSRINPSQCPLVSKAFVKQQCRNLKSNKNPISEVDLEKKQTAVDKPMCLKNTGEDELEEILLIKWRGKSFLHCSWERPNDLEIFDTTNNTAKGKIKRFYQSQHMSLGKDWRKVLETRIGLETESSVKEDFAGDSNNKWKDHLHLHGMDDEEYFSPDCIEVERILSCDESEMDMSVLSAQREINLRAEKERNSQQAQKLLKKTDATATEDEFSFLDEEKPWDPEDNVRYVVKWKGLQLTEITWEYWMHIKHKCVEEAEDFWSRQKPSDLNNSNRIYTHPAVREYKKLTESPVFGIPVKKRADGKADDPEPNLNGVTETTIGLQLRTYQLEGVNWLLWNWWNKRSCILADEMVRYSTSEDYCKNIPQRL